MKFTLLLFTIVFATIIYSLPVPDFDPNPPAFNELLSLKPPKSQSEEGSTPASPFVIWLSDSLYLICWMLCSSVLVICIALVGWLLKTPVELIYNRARRIGEESDEQFRYLYQNLHTNKLNL